MLSTLQETPFIEKIPQEFCNLGTQPDIGLHLGPAQIDIAITQAGIICHIFIIQLEGWCIGPVQDFNRVAQDLNLSGWQLPVYSTLRAVPYLAGNVQDVFVSHCLSNCKRARLVRIKYNLDNTRTVTQIDENYTAVIAAPVYPATELHLLTQK